MVQSSVDEDRFAIIPAAALQSDPRVKKEEKEEKKKEKCQKNTVKKGKRRRKFEENIEKSRTLNMMYKR